MNSQDVKEIKYITQPTNGSEPREITEEVVFFLRNGNDLRSPGAYGDRRRVGNNIGDGWNDETNRREVLNEEVDARIERLERMGYEYTLIFEKDLEKE